MYVWWITIIWNEFVYLIINFLKITNEECSVHIRKTLKSKFPSTNQITIQPIFPQLIIRPFQLRQGIVQTYPFFHILIMLQPSRLMSRIKAADQSRLRILLGETREFHLFQNHPSLLPIAVLIGRKKFNSLPVLKEYLRIKMIIWRCRMSFSLKKSIS